MRKNRWRWIGWLFSMLLTGSLLLTSCSVISGTNPATLTAQAERNSPLATEMALRAQATALTAERSATRTAWAVIERGTQAVFDQQATGTAEVIQQTAEIEALEARITADARELQQKIRTAKNWPSVVIDSFDQVSPGWSAGEKDGQYITLSWDITDGKYRWEAAAKTGGAVSWVDPGIPPTSDFYLAVDVLQTSGAPNAEAGIIFRAGDNGFWCLRISGEGELFVGLFVNGDWQFSMPMGLSAVRAGQPNRLSVIAQGPRVIFLVNDEDLISISKDTPLSGLAGLMVTLWERGDQATWEFDNFELRAPPGAQPMVTATP